MSVQKSDTTATLILEWLEEYCPDKAPIAHMEEYQLGILVGQRNMIEHLKIKLKVNQIEEEIK